MVELIIMNISMLMYLILERYIELEIIFVYYLVFRICERVMGLIILILAILIHYGDDYYYLFSLNKFQRFMI